MLERMDGCGCIRAGPDVVFTLQVGGRDFLGGASEGMAREGEGRREGELGHGSVTVLK